MKPEQRYENDEFAYSKDYNGRIQVITEETYNRISELNFGEVLHVEPGVFETRREEICDLYTLNIVQRYMNSIFAK